MVAGEGFSKLALFLFSVALGRRNPVEVFGYFCFALASVRVLGVFADFGLNTLTSRDLAAHPEHKRVLFKRFLILKLALTGAIAIIGLAAIPFIRSQVLKILFVWVLAGGLFDTLGDFSDSVLLAERRADRVAIGKGLQGALLAGGAGLILSRGLPLAGQAGLFAAAGMLHMATSALFTKRSVGVATFEFGEHKMGAVLQEAYSLGILNVLIMVYLRADTLLLQWIKGAYLVGLYGAAIRFKEAFAIALAAIMRATFPEMARAYREGYKHLRSLCIRMMVVLSCGFVPVGGALALFAPRIIGKIFGAGYLEATPALRLLMLSTALIYLNNPLFFMIIAGGRQKELVRFFAGGVVLNVVLNLILIPGFGIVGAACASLATEGFILAAMAERALRAQHWIDEKAARGRDKRGALCYIQ